MHIQPLEVSLVNTFTSIIKIMLLEDEILIHFISVKGLQLTVVSLHRHLSQHSIFRVKLDTNFSTVYSQPEKIRTLLKKTPLSISTIYTSIVL